MFLQLEEKRIARGDMSFIYATTSKQEAIERSQKTPVGVDT